MSTVADLERLQALTERLTPIGSMCQGELIRAQDWNTLIGTVVEIARAVLAADHQLTPVPHEHADQVGVGWLEPKLRALIERGPLSDPAAMTRLQNLEQRVDRLTQRVDDLVSHVGEVRDRVTEVSSHDLVRQADVTNVRRVLEGLADGRESVRELRESLRAIQKDVTTAVTIGQRFVVDGEPIDGLALIERIDSLEASRERLRAPDGELFDAKGFENRLTKLTNTLVTQEQLDAALHTVQRDVSPDELAAIENNLRTSLTEQVNTSFIDLSNAIRTETNTRLAAVDGLVSQTVSDALPDFTTSVLNAVRPDISAAVERGVGASQARFDKQLSELSAALSADYTQKIDDVQVRLGAAVRTEFANQLPVAIAPLQTRLDSLAKLVEPMGTRLDNAEAGLNKFATRNEEVRLELIDRDTKMRDELLGEIDKRDTLRGLDITTRFTQFEQLVDNKIKVAVTDNRRALLEETRVIAQDTVTTEVNLASTKLRNEFAVISRNSVAELVQTEVHAAQPLLVRHVATELNRLR